MLATQGQSGQALLFNLRYDFSNDWAVFVNGTEDFQTTLSRQAFPYLVQGAKQISIDDVKLCVGNAGKVVSTTPTLDYGALSSALSAVGGSATIDLPPDNVMVRDQNQQVLLVIQFHFGL